MSDARRELDTMTLESAGEVLVRRKAERKSTSGKKKS